jgi:hypothetical protein
MAKRAARKTTRKATKRRKPARPRSELYPPHVENPLVAGVALERTDLTPITPPVVESVPVGPAAVAGEPVAAPVLGTGLGEDFARSGVAPNWTGLAYLVKSGAPIFPSQVDAALAAQALPTGKRPERLKFALLNDADRQAIMTIVVTMKDMGWSSRKIQQHTRIDRTELALILRLARQHQGLNDVLKDVDLSMLPQAADNMRRVLEDPRHPKNYDASVKLMAGRGILVTHAKSAAAVLSQTTLEVTFKNLPGSPDGPLPVPTPGIIVGKPREDC